MNKVLKILGITLFAFITTGMSPIASADSNPFPGVPYGSEIPGYSKIIICSDTPQIPDDCVRQGGGQVTCPNGSANDITPTLREDGSWASLKSWCRNSWTPPTTVADDEDFRNRQQLAIAAATLESQAYNAAHPGEQKCVTWGPIVHANGISTASGGVCANPVGTRSDGSTIQVAPSQVGSSQSLNSGNSDSSTIGVGVGIQVPDLTQYGIGKPFTKVVSGNISTSSCPSGFQAASNDVNTGVGVAATECWPDNAWAAYSAGGSVWSQFKSSNGSIDAQAETNRRVQVNALRSLALQQAQMAANETIGVKRCNSWSGFGESGQECAYIPYQSNHMLGTPILTSIGDTSTTLITLGEEVGGIKVVSPTGLSLQQWQQNPDYLAIICPNGSGRSSTIDLHGTLNTADDTWITTCIKIAPNPYDLTSTDSVTANSTPIVDSSTLQSASGDTKTSTINSVAIKFKGTANEIIQLAYALDISDTETAAIISIQKQLSAIRSTSKLTKLKLPNSPILDESASSNTPSICKVTARDVTPRKAGTCTITFRVEGDSGNTFETQKKIVFKK